MTIGASSGVGGTSSNLVSSTSDTPHSPTPPLQRRLAKSFSVAPSGSQTKGFYLNLFLFVSLSFDFLKTF